MFLATASQGRAVASFVRFGFAAEGGPLDGEDADDGGLGVAEMKSNEVDWASRVR